ncbi:hypothetical protein RIF29_35769 [Crotalaria pallida]|uniref:Reverse transcriptase zinc-binding domain-containing protein n=1 Tax=Crotalaria pallida TaxID=3830 RepID=A0AAN9EBJ0_CROPI
MSNTMKSIFRATERLKDGFDFRFGEGNTSFWYGSWCKAGPLCESVPYVHISDTGKSIRDVWRNGEWDWNSLYTTIPTETADIVNQVRILGFGELKDVWGWSGKDDGIYTASSGYKWLSHTSRNHVSDESWSWLWKISCPEKVRFLMWLMLHNAIPTNVFRCNRGLAASPMCSRCDSDCETVLHCIRDCPYSRDLWYRFGFTDQNFFSMDVWRWVRSATASNSCLKFVAVLWWAWR